MHSNAGWRFLKRRNYGDGVKEVAAVGPGVGNTPIKLHKTLSISKSACVNSYPEGVFLRNRPLAAKNILIASAGYCFNGFKAIQPILRQRDS